MERGEMETIAGISLIALFSILAFIFGNTDNSIVSWIVFFGIVIGGGILVHVLMITEIGWVKIVSKAFFIIPIVIVIGFLLFWGITISYDASRNSFTGYLQFLPWVFVWGLLILIYALEIFLFMTVNKTKNKLIKTLTWIVGVSIYFTTGVIGAAIVSPPGFGTYGTPLYKPKRK